MNHSIVDAKYAKWVPGLRVYYLLLPVVLVYLLIGIWPEVQPSSPERWNPTVDLLFVEPFDLSPESRMLLIVVLAGAIGSVVHGATSLTTYLGNRTLMTSWTWWYWLRPMIGIGIALIFYFAVRGGFLLLVTSDTSYKEVNPFGVAAIAGLSGMFSKQATDKLREVFDSMFRSAGDKERGDKVWEGKLVADLMVKRKEMQGCEVEDGKDESVSIQQLYDVVQAGCSRVPVFNSESGSVRCMIHQSLLFDYIARASIAASKGGAQFRLEDHSLKQLLEFQDVGEKARETLAFVKPGVTVGEAKREMDGVEGCQDVFVTEDGKRSGRVLGWMTNVDIGKLSRA